MWTSYIMQLTGQPIGEPNYIMIAIGSIFLIGIIIIFIKIVIKILKW
jgi:hypothetical protein